MNVEQEVAKLAKQLDKIVSEENSVSILCIIINQLHIMKICRRILTA